MNRILYRALFLLFVLAGLRVSAQSSQQSDVALWTVGSFIADTSITADENETIDLTFDEEPGFGVSFNHYWTDRFSTELSVMTFRADLSASAFLLPDTRLGELDGRAVTAMAQWHFLRDRRVSPYIAGGVAHISGTFDPVVFEGEEDEGEIDLESDTTWAAAVGMDINLTDHWALSFEAKRVPWDAVEEGGVPEDEIDVDPMLYGSGVRFRF